MRYIIVLIIFIIAVGLLYMGTQCLIQAKQYGQKAREFKQEIQRVNEQLAVLSKYKGSQGETLDVNFRVIYGVVKYFALYLGTSVQISTEGGLAGAKDQGKQMVLRGVRSLMAKATFSKVEGLDAYFFILTMLDQMGKKFPFDVLRLECKAGALAVVFNVYGI